MPSPSPPPSRPASPPLHAWSTSTPPNPSSSFAPNQSDSIKATGSEESTPASSHLDSTETAFTTPDSAKSPASHDAPFTRVGEASVKPPRGFEHLEQSFQLETGQAARNFEWETFVSAASSDESLETPRVRYTRRLGPTEASYYLGSRGEGIEGGVNDMYLHLGFKARSSLVTPDRVLDAWTEVARRHALLTSSVQFKDYYDTRFVYDAPADLHEARLKAAAHLSLLTGKKGKDLLDDYLNGPRLLSDQRLAHLVISTPEEALSPSETPTSGDGDAEQGYDFFLFCTHFIGDGMALHSTANEFFTLLSGSPSSEDIESKNIEAILSARGEEPSQALAEDQATPVARARTLAPAMESMLAVPSGWKTFGWAAAKVEFGNEQAKLIGGHTFPRARLGTRHTVVPTVSWSADDTRKILAACKRHGVTVAHAMFALSNLAYARTVEEGRRKPELPVMLYSALNVRPSLAREDPPVDWYHLAISYFNIILPSFLPRDVSPSTTFWHQCLSVKAQTARAAKSPLLAPRTALMALERERRSIGFERADDERREREAKEAMAGLGISGVEGVKKEEVEQTQRQKSVEGGKTQQVEQKRSHSAQLEDKDVRPKAPSQALMGLSMLGNLDGMYNHADFHGIKLHTLTTGSRQRPGALLLFAYTFAGRMWVSLGYDENGFEPGLIERWRTALVEGVDEVLVGDGGGSAEA